MVTAHPAPPLLDPGHESRYLYVQLLQRPLRAAVHVLACESGFGPPSMWLAWVSKTTKLVVIDAEVEAGGVGGFHVGGEGGE